MYPLRLRRARQCAGLFRNNTFLCRPLRHHHQVKCSKTHFFLILFLMTSAIAGSPGWLAARNANPSVILAPSSTNKGRKAAPGDSASVASTSSRGAKSLSPSPSITSPTPSAMANYRARNDVTWKRGPPVSSVASAITSRAPSTVGGSSARSSRGAPPASSLAPSLSFGPVRRPPYDPNGPAEPSRNYEYAEEDQPKHSTVAAMSDIFNDDPDYDQGNPPADAAEHAIDQSEAGDPEAPWEGYDIPRQEPATKVIIKPEGEWKCSQHGSLCSPGICEERARFEHDKRMEENRKKREEERKRREARREKNRKRREKKDAEAEAMGQGGRGPPPHFRRGNTSSGGGGSNNNASVPDTDPSRDRGSSVSPPPVQGDRSIPWEARSADAQSTMSSVLRARDSATGSDEDDCDREDDGASVTESDTSNRSSDASCSRSRSPAPASANFSVRSNDNGNASPPPASPTSPRPASPQSAQDARSSTSQTPSVSESVRPSVSGHSRAPSVSAASTTGSDTGQRSGTRPPTRQSTSDARSSVSSSARGRATPSVTPSGPEGFPSFDNTQWGDPIAMAMADAAKGESATGTSEDCAGQKLSKSAKKGSNAKSVPAPAPAQASTIETVFEVELPPGGPGSSWGDPDEPW
ncbi:hypothetical protein EI94DRAFT_1743006 [Lactarius quietus]|nr:hypothetical protein EI94DRAFT_1743006 [Lactarius quietus]